MPTRATVKRSNPKTKQQTISSPVKRNIRAKLKSASWYSGAAQSIGISNVLRQGDAPRTRKDQQRSP
jgi:hypothetical protein